MDSYNNCFLTKLATWRKVSSAGSVAEQTGLSLCGAGSVAEQTGLSLRGERFPQLGLVAEQTVHQQIWSWRDGQFN